MRRDLPPEVDEVVARALAKSPADRFATCGEFVAALREALVPTGSTRRRPPAPDPRRAERERRPLGLGRITAAALVLAAAGAAGVFAGMTVAGEEGSASERTVTQMRTVTQPPLLAYVPAALRPRCRRTRPPRPDFDDSLLCRGGPTVRAVRYSRALTVDALHDYFADRAVAVAGVRPGQPGRELRAVGSCNFQRLPAVLEWSAIRREGHETIEANQGLDAEGQVICRESVGKTHIEWIAFESKIYAHAYGPDYRSVYRWWLLDSGPIN
jgi:hypothetical protein